MSGRLPDWVVLGPPRTGTTWLHRALLRQPGVFVPREKQLHFFDADPEPDPEAYAARFSPAPPGVPAGELTPDYFGHPRAAERLGRILPPEARLILIYRDPVERAFSEYRMRVRAGTARADFLSLLERDSVLQANSLYGRNLERLLAHVEPDRVRVLPFRTLETDPPEFLKAFRRAVGARDPVGWSAAPAHRIGSTPVARWPAVDRAVARARAVMEERALGEWVLNVARRVGLPRLWHALVHDAEQAGDPDPDTRRRAGEILDPDRELFFRILREKRPVGAEELR